MGLSANHFGVVSFISRPTLVSSPIVPYRRAVVGHVNSVSTRSGVHSVLIRDRSLHTAVTRRPARPGTRKEVMTSSGIR